MFLGRQPDASDVARLIFMVQLRGEIEPSEAQTVFHGIHLGELLGVMRAGRLALSPALWGAAGLEKNGTQTVVGLLTQAVQPVVEGGEVRLFGLEVGRGGA